jgi:GNAT superfamily N-acetyltransferase
MICNHLQEKTLQSFERGSLCESCHPISTSQWQLNVEEWVRSLNMHVKRGDRTAIAPKEIDIFVPEKRFGIECHGLYFHSDAKNGNDRSSHLRKAEIAESNGIRLLQIFFDEWRDRQEIVKGMIRSRLDIGIERVGARKCKIVEVNTCQQREFFESSHLSGYVPARIAWGLSWNDRIIACLSARVPRQSKWSSFFEISRFAVTPGFRVQGGLSRLVRTALEWSRAQGKDGLMTYVDRRVGTGEGYRRCGFIERGATGADYWYTDFTSRFDRFKFRARDGKSERQVAFESKVFKIWGTGSRIMTLGDI